MSCNCNNRPCTCANANCACPPDYTFQPASINCQNPNTCEDSLTANCVFTSVGLTCSQVAVGTDLMTALQKIDAKVCTCGSCSGTTISPNSDYYVDSSVLATGNGSILYPFKTLEEAYNAIIGVGTASAPTHTGITVHVATGVGYTTPQNIYTYGGQVWVFEKGTTVAFNGSGTYFIDSSGFPLTYDEFSIRGGLNFTTITGGFLMHSRGHATGNPTIINIEAQFIQGGTPTSNVPLIYLNQLSSPNGGDGAQVNINMFESYSSIQSGFNDTIKVTGGRLYINLNGGSIGYGRYGFSDIGVSGGHVINYTNTDTATGNIGSNFVLKNGYIFSNHCTDMVYMSGYFNNFIIDNIISSKDIILNSYVKPSRFLNIGDVTLTSGFDGLWTFLIKDTILIPYLFNILDGSPVIDFTGVQAQRLSYLEMHNCILYNTCNISSLIHLGEISSGLSSVAVATYNVINGNFMVTQLPTSSAGLSVGMVWNNSGILTIV